MLLRVGAAWLLAAACTCALAAAPRGLRFEHLGVEQGLPQESVNSILQDREGFIWFGTQAGLARFDGYQVAVFRNEAGNPASLPDNSVLAGHEDTAGRLWFGTNDGLTRFDAATRSFIRYPDNSAQRAPANRAVTAIAADGHGGLWLGTGDGLKHFDPVSGRFDSYRRGGADERVSALARDPAGGLWVGGPHGLDRLAPASRHFEHFAVDPLGGRGNTVLALSMGPRDTLWIGTAGGLSAWRIGAGAPQRRRLGAADGMSEGRIDSLYHDAGANLWVGTERDGLLWNDPASGQFVQYRHNALDPHSLVEDQVEAIFVDRTGTLWVGNGYGGVNRADLASGGFERFANAPGDPGSLGNNKVRAVTGDGFGRLWVGTAGGLDLLDPAGGKADHLRHQAKRQNSLPDDTVTALERIGQRLWIGSPTGLASYERQGKRFSVLPLGPEPDANSIEFLRAGRHGVLWVATRGGLHQVAADGETVRTWRHEAHNPRSLGDDSVFALIEDRHGTLWVGTDNGLDRYDEVANAFAHFRHEPDNPTSLRHSRVYCLYESVKGELWIGTAAGLHRMEIGADGQTRFRFFPLTEGGAAGPIDAILEDGAGHLWISNSAGITRLDPASGRFKAYDAKDGLLDGSYFVGAAHAASSGELYFGGVNGLTAFRPDAIRDNPYAPTVVITDFLVFNQSKTGGLPIHRAQALSLSHRDSVFSLEFAALHFADPQRNRYAYQLEGFDQGWVDTGADKRFATYTNLDPGEYLFRVKASNKDGVWSEAPATLAITITPPWWKTWWFRAAAALLLAGSAYAVYRWRVHALIAQKSWLARQVDIRTAELLLEKEAVEQQKQEALHQKEEVEMAHRNISLLSDIGRRLTAALDSESIMAMLYEHVDELMDASVFGIGVYHPERRAIDYPFAMERGKRYAPYSRSMDEPEQLAVWCIVNEREVFINDLDAEYHHYIKHLELTSGAENMGTLDDGSLPVKPCSLLYVPIAVNGRMLGVVTVHSFRPNAYHRIHLDMLRTLAAYVGVAFDNANAYRQLKDTQAQLVAQDKLAALGSLVAGVAHELNTPIGNSVLMASTLQERTEQMAQRFDDGKMRRSELGEFIAASRDASALIMRSLFNAAELVNSFKQVAVDQASAQRRVFDLEQVSHEVAATMMNQVRKAGHTLMLAVPHKIVLDSFPGPYGQVLINFVNNAMLHAFSEPGGRMELAAATLEPGRVQIIFRDDGAGIPVEHQARIFDPFFTTKMGQGGSGLGLNITYNIVTSLLGGNIRVESSAALGTSFILDIPLTAPAAGTP